MTQTKGNSTTDCIAAEWWLSVLLGGWKFSGNACIPMWYNCGVLFPSYCMWRKRRMLLKRQNGSRQNGFAELVQTARFHPHAHWSYFSAGKRNVECCMLSREQEDNFCGCAEGHVTLCCCGECGRWHWHTVVCPHTFVFWSPATDVYTYWLQTIVWPCLHKLTALVVGLCSGWFWCSSIVVLPKATILIILSISGMQLLHSPSFSDNFYSPQGRGRG